MVSTTSFSFQQMYEHDFNEWMTSGQANYSLWSDEAYRNALLTYIGRMYGQKIQIGHLFVELEKQRERMDEIDFLNVLLRRTEEQLGVREMFQEWNNKMRPRKRFNELKSLFNLDRVCDKFKVSPINVRNMDPQNIRAYFDLGCSTGEITARLGKYLGLRKENIFGGDIYHRATKEITFISIDESEPIINLPDHRVDLITCLVSLHHIMPLNRVLSELARITRPGGYLILREHDCKLEHSIRAKYLNFLHVIRTLSFHGEFDCCSENLHTNDADLNRKLSTWSEEKSRVLEQTKTIRYRSRDEWQKALEYFGFSLYATIDYKINPSTNLQRNFYAIYQRLS